MPHDNTYTYQGEIFTYHQSFESGSSARADLFLNSNNEKAIVVLSRSMRKKLTLLKHVEKNDFSRLYMLSQLFEVDARIGWFCLIYPVRIIFTGE